MWFANFSQIKVGLITVIWSINRLYMAAADYFLFKTRLKCFHLIGKVLIVGCTILLCLKSIIIKNDSEIKLESVLNEAPKIVKEAVVLPMWMLVSFWNLDTGRLLLQWLTVEVNYWR